MPKMPFPGQQNWFGGWGFGQGGNGQGNNGQGGTGQGGGQRDGTPTKSIQGANQQSGNNSGQHH
jgi:hypothetical protein